ncbi:hypothetical protein [Photobacterium damselae]|uniref:hypothetical protein n=1 Tax=Photobacterium damselae TaxID=38293 RepID=UPI0040684DAF
MATFFCDNQNHTNIVINATDNATLQDLLVPANSRIGLIVNYSETVSEIKKGLSESSKLVLDVCLSDKSSFSSDEVLLLKGALNEHSSMPKHYKDMFDYVIDHATNSGFKFDSVQTGILN